MFEPYPLILTPLWYRKGYYKIQLGRCDGTRTRKRLYLHRMVWEAFNGPIPPTLTVNHIDGSHDNNRLDNLELATQLEQTSHARALGLQRHRTKTGFRAATVTEDKVRELRVLRAQGWSQNALATRYNIARSNVRWILIGRTWSHVA